MTQNEPRHFLDAIYLDTNILRSAGLNLNKLWMSEVRSFAGERGIHLCITKLVLAEWCEDILESLRRRRQQMLSASDFLMEYEIEVPYFNEALLTLPEGNTLIRLISERLGNAGFEIIDNWTGSLEQLIDEAVHHCPPFEKGDKGFRDAVILESYVLHASQQFENPRVMVISNDEAVGHSQERFSRQGIDVTIVRASESPDRLKALLDDETALFLKERENRLFEFVKRHEEEILAFVSKSPLEFTEWWLEPPSVEEDLIQVLWKSSFQSSVKSILSAKPIRVIKAVGGAPLPRKKVPHDRYPLEIWVQIELEVIIYEPWPEESSSSYRPPGIPKPKEFETDYRPRTFDEMQDSLIEQLVSLELSKGRKKKAVIKGNVYVEATVSSKGAEHGEYEDLKLDRLH